MKRRYLILLPAMLLTLSLTGCESVTDVANTVTDTVSEAAGSLTTVVSEKLGLSEETETELAEGQRKATIQVVSITGNELTYIEETEEETDAETETEDASEVDTEEESGTEAGDETEPESDLENHSDTDIEEDTGSEMSDENSGRDSSERGQRGNMDMSSIADAMSDMDLSDIADVMSGEESISDLIGEAEEEDQSVTVYLPVGVVVYTTTGKEKTFSILQAGDELEVLFETDADGNEVITKMWLVSTS